MASSLDRWVGKVAIVTGASAGIGAAIAEALVNVGINVVGLARRKERIEALAAKLVGKQAKLYAFKADITKEQDIIDAFEWTKKNVGPIHILVNNAGGASVTSLSDGETELWKRAIDLNVLGLCIATREAIRDMKANNVDGHIIHINSTLGHHILDLPGMNVYPATKFAVTALTESLRHELNNQGCKIKVTSLSPGLVRTEFGGAAEHYPAIQEMIRNSPILESEDVANALVYVLSTPPNVQISELTIQPVGESG